MILSSFKTYVKYDFKRTDKDTELVQAYNDAIIQVSNQIPHGAYKYQSYIPVVAQQEDYPIDDQCIHIIHPLRYLEGSASGDSGYTMEHIDKKEYDSREPNPNRTSPDNTNSPTAYTIFSRSVLVTPIPSATDVTDGGLIEMNWTKLPTDQSADSDTPPLGGEWREILKNMTLSRLYAGIGLFDEAQQWKATYEDQYGTPIGQYKRLIEIETVREEELIGRVQYNDL